MKEKDATLVQWQTLIALTQKIIAIEPWKQFEDMEIFVLKLPNQSDNVYASIMGFHKMCYGLSFYEGIEGYKDISTIAYEIKDKRFENFVTMESSFYSVYFDDQDNVSWKQQQIFKKLGLKPKQYPHFTVKEKGCFPDDPDASEVEKYTLYIAGLLEAIEYFLKHEIRINFTKDMFVYDVQAKNSTFMPFHLTPREYDAILPNDESYLNALLEIECNDDIWEVEYNYINQGMEREDGRLVNVRFAMIASTANGSMLSCVPLEDNQDDIEVVLDSFFQCIEKHGRPDSVFFNNVRMLPLLAPSCDCLEIEIEEVEELPVIDAFMKGFYEYVGHEEMA
ncbi:MAG: hypothetical protein EOM50_00010 [Erysipelotrichia bacterium]|nr:hypothetical protein [Erysipelotrichia bacterium]